MLFTEYGVRRVESAIAILRTSTPPFRYLIHPVCNYFSPLFLFLLADYMYKKNGGLSIFNHCCTAIMVGWVYLNALKKIPENSV